MELLLLRQVKGIPGCIQLLDFFENEKNCYYVMERPTRCKDMADMLMDDGPFNETDCKNYFSQILQTTKACLEAGVFHRDLKEENVLVDLDTKMTKIIDFGCGDLMHKGFYKEYNGTREYFPPEWITQERYRGVPATVWSLGVILFSMACGDVPFTTSREIVRCRYAFPEDRILSSELKDLINWMLNVNPEERPSLEMIAECAWMKG